MKKKALLNGKIRTPEGYVQAMLVEGQTIALLGTSEEVAGAGGGAEKIDLGGRLCLPGFIDGHMHFIAYALSLEQVGLNGCRSVHEVRSRLKTFLDQERPSQGSWVVGRGWNHELFDDGRIFEREDIDGLTPDNPVILTRVCGHVAVLNTRALEALGIGSDSRFPGGVVDLDEKGVPTGVVRETVVEWVHSRRPLPCPDKLRDLVARAGKRASEAGLTSVHSDDLGIVGGNWQGIIDLYMGLDREGKMPLRVTEQLLLRDRPALDAFLSSGWRTGDGSPFFHIGPLKILTDGSMGGRTAYLKEEYSDMPGAFGVPIYRAEELDGLASAAHRAGMQIAMHAIGDGALDMCLDALEKAMSEKDRDARHYIVHCQMGCMEQYRQDGPACNRCCHTAPLCSIGPPHGSQKDRGAQGHFRIRLEDAEGPWDFSLRGIRLPCGALRSTVGDPGGGNQAGQERFPPRRMESLPESYSGGSGRFIYRGRRLRLIRGTQERLT